VEFQSDFDLDNQFYGDGEQKSERVEMPPERVVDEETRVACNRRVGRHTKRLLTRQRKVAKLQRARVFDRIETTAKEAHELEI